MASTILRRQLSRAPRLVPSSSCLSGSPLIARRQLSSSPQTNAQHIEEPSLGARSTGAKNVFETHTVEDLKGIPHTDILAETGTRRDAEMRHFTGMLIRKSHTPRFV